MAEKVGFDDLAGALGESGFGDGVEAPTPQAAAAAPAVETVSAPVPVSLSVEEQVISPFDLTERSISEVEKQKARARAEMPVTETAAPVPVMEEAGVPVKPVSEEQGIAPETVAQPTEAPQIVAERVEPAGTEAAPSFADGVARAGAIASGAVSGVEALKTGLETEATGYKGEDWRQKQEEAFAGEKSAEEVRVDRAALDKFKGRFPNADVAEIEDGVKLQEQYKLGREMAADAMKVYERKLRGVVRELTPGRFGKEAALQQEMKGLGGFFGELGELDKQREAVEYWEKAMSELMWGLVDDKKKRAKSAEVAEMKRKIASHESMGGLLEMGNMPAELRNVITAARKGESYDFGEGLIGDFRKRIYTDVLVSLGLELGSGAAAAPVEPAAAETTPAGASVRESASAPSLEVAADEERAAEKTMGEMADKMRGLADKMVEASRLVGVGKMRAQFRTAAVEAVSEMGAMFTGANREKMKDAWDMLDGGQRKNILGVLLHQAKNGVRGVSGMDVGEAIRKGDRSARAGAAGLLIEIISMLIDKPIGVVIAELQEQTK